MKRFTILLILSSIIYINVTSAQETQDKPKLVVGIVVDQMRQEYIFKYKNRYTEGGFNRLVNGGFMMKNAHFNYIPTYTGPGHASIYSGTTPSTHGIIANEWYIRKLGKSIYCVEDSTVTKVGGSTLNGQISPRNLLTTTITDELRFSSNRRSKVVGIALKDRGAVLPAGHLGDAYWYDGVTGEFMTSSYYKDQLPLWVQDFNAKGLAKEYLSKDWETLYPISTYVQSIEDHNQFEGTFIGKESSSFPYDLSALMEDNEGMGLITTTPFGNSLTLDMAYAALEGEKLGMGEETDFLAISFSSPDYIGHKFGPSSIELEDNYLRLDLEIAEFLRYLDNTYGEGEYLVFLTSDHGVAELAEYMESLNIPAGRQNGFFILSQLVGFASEKFDDPYDIRPTITIGLVATLLAVFFFILLQRSSHRNNRIYGQGFLALAFVGFLIFLAYREYHIYKNRTGNWIENYSNEQVYINHKLAKEKGKDIGEMQQSLAAYALTLKGVKEVYTASDLKRFNYSEGRSKLLQQGFNHKASGDIAIILEPGWISISWKGTTHGTGYSYDTHIPLIFYGWNVPPGESAEYCAITDIAPTLSMMLDIRLPNGATGKPILPIL